MKVLIAFRSKYGVTEACALALAGMIRAEVELADLSFRRTPPVRDFDVVLIGGSIYGGGIQREVTSFCDRHELLLLQRPVGIFVCCFYEGEHARAQIQAVFPSWLHAHAFARVHFGGALHFSRLNALDRLLVRCLVHPAGDIELIKKEAVEKLADAVNGLRPGV